jgi:hypothetical protein
LQKEIKRTKAGVVSGRSRAVNTRHEENVGFQITLKESVTTKNKGCECWSNRPGNTLEY